MAQKQFNGQDRRVRPHSDRRSCTVDDCMEHSGLTAKIDHLMTKTNIMESKNFVSWAQYKWSMGLMVSIFISLFTISIYLTIDGNQALKEIEKKQITIMGNISHLQLQVEEIKHKVRKP